ncbi:MAG: hypothetical protein WBK70_09075, partial [Thermacetogeniaceae bacterium]
RDQWDRLTDRTKPRGSMPPGVWFCGLRPAACDSGVTLSKASRRRQPIGSYDAIMVHSCLAQLLCFASLVVNRSFVKTTFPGRCAGKDKPAVQRPINGTVPL